ncbi:hypothetical protein DFR58_1722 [Anaerobacterium chartisolvens]|uniref:Uncharacterized protein n=1 Tax=Anaerobacterium chartisolvens TaxID=1297424 RepID=A0A369AHD6_9FIRM|nr:hypothetical protein [Anaerobacterium chartisolvens]RCX06854.1 hypothetical protein DFR58_1722 [Anaerobacterium chartisolvens]
MKMLNRIKIRNKVELLCFYGKYILLIGVPVLILIFKNVIFDSITPIIIKLFPQIVDSIISNAKSINDVSNILLGAFIPFAGTWAYNSSQTRGKNACYKKEIFYKGIHEDLLYLNKLPHDIVCRNTFRFWSKYKNSISIMCINKTLRKFVDNHYDKHCDLQELKKEFNLFCEKKIFEYIGQELENNGKYPLLHSVYDLIFDNDEKSIKREIELLLKCRNTKYENSDINKIYNDVFKTINQCQEYYNIKNNAILFKRNNADLINTIEYLIKFINKHYEASDNLA